MEKQKVIFVKNLIQKKHDQVSDSSEETFNKIASAIFNKDDFYEVILKLFGAQYLG